VSSPVLSNIIILFVCMSVSSLITRKRVRLSSLDFHGSSRPPEDSFRRKKVGKGVLDREP